ncbi:MAGE-like protein 2 [Drosophila eugracilis]|uniref:MAGE-like protein 2 n=1 Tax=Drosophila eugracilis TaxID=29029 RepID=UPI001BDAE0F5|nr:MAGE-like protein 2 [Drosophila eugracilis]
MLSMSLLMEPPRLLMGPPLPPMEPPRLLTEAPLPLMEAPLPLMEAPPQLMEAPPQQMEAPPRLMEPLLLRLEAAHLPQLVIAQVQRQDHPIPRHPLEVTTAPALAPVTETITAGRGASGISVAASAVSVVNGLSAGETVETTRTTGPARSI